MIIELSSSAAVATAILIGHALNLVNETLGGSWPDFYMRTLSVDSVISRFADFCFCSRSLFIIPSFFSELRLRFCS